MTTNNPSFLRFSVEESVCFQKGQEVSELISISLDPDIMIQEHEQYVAIRGGLKLTGEYRIAERESGIEEAKELPAGRLINEVTTREDGISEIKHLFPVDITIPKNRIQSLDDIYVGIDTFDYELPDHRMLQLIADLSISGIYGSQQSVPTVETVEAAEVEEETAEETFEEIKQNEKQSDVFQANFQALEEKDTLTQEIHEDISEEELALVREETKPEEEAEGELEGDSIIDSKLSFIPVQTNFDEDEDFYTPFEVEARKEVYQEPINSSEEPIPVEVFEEKEESPQIELKVRADQKTSYGSHVVERKGSVAVKESVANMDAPAADANVKRDENALYLTKIFARDEAEDFSRLKICIAQSGDSLDTIAERYDVSIQQLLRYNQLSSDYDVNEGQLLYIPSAT